LVFLKEKERKKQKSQEDIKPVKEKEKTLLADHLLHLISVSQFQQLLSYLASLALFSSIRFIRKSW
jgi:hypothetical protein